uniref:Malonyl-CoA decarboxylase C-terminal domain-containing protein n=1 Tax=Corethron hystrix TaxID=216773 RepID=A0A7S1BP46_9STRA|mmetsp:Transcript_33181/g.76554  ORF Transcript_33181/g.76554 Transcript_33181/m.76554 type:complete len:500 (+) Transcript_33181:742-2241(+)
MTPKIKKEFLHVSTTGLIKVFCSNYLSITQSSSFQDRTVAVNSVLLHLATWRSKEETINKTTTRSKTTTNYNKQKKSSSLHEKLFEIFLLTDHAVFSSHHSGIRDHIWDKEDGNRHIGLHTLVQLRADLRSWLARGGTSSSDERLPHDGGAGGGCSSSNSKLRALDSVLRVSLTRCICSPGSLSFQRIAYDQTSAAVIEFIAKREAVHPIQNLEDLRKRLGRFGKRCFALFHSEIKEPLVFVHVALLSDMASSMEEITNAEDTEDRERDARIAIFYSINATSQGLSGIDLGEILIKRVVRHLQSEPNLDVQQFATLSPIPHFRKWLEGKGGFYHKETGAENDSWSQASSKFGDNKLLNDKEKENVKQLLSLKSGDDALISLLNILDDTEWYHDVKMQHVLKPILMRLAARYLLEEKYRGKPLDGVARFHVGNGATVSRLNFLADLSKKGLRNSASIMVNYLYELENIEANQAHFEADGTIPTKSDVIDWLLDECMKSKI